MTDQTSWNAIESLRALLELVPDSRDGNSRLQPCMNWLGRKLIPLKYVSPDSQKTPLASEAEKRVSRPVTGKRLTRAPLPTDSVVIDDVAYDDSPANYDTYIDFLTAQFTRENVQNPDEVPTITTPANPTISFSAPSVEPVTEDETGNSVPPFWKTDYPLKAINETMSKLKPLLPRILAAVEIDQDLRRRLVEASDAKSGFLEEDMRGTLAADLVGPPESKAVMKRNDDRLEALGVLLRALRTRPEVVLKVAVNLILEMKAELEGWEFNVQEGVIRYQGVASAKLDSAVVLYVKTVCDASPAYTIFEDFLSVADRQGVLVPTRKLEWMKKNIPPQYFSMLEFKTGCGARLKTDSRIS